MMDNICAIIVTYNSSFIDIKKVVDSVAKQVDAVVLINNDGNHYAGEFSYFENIEEHVLNDNFGIAFAQNVGMRIAVERGYEYVMLSDQDTVYPDDYISTMLPVFSTDKAIGAVAPGFIDINVSEPAPAFVFSNGNSFVTRKVCAGSYDIFHAIASGLIIRTEVLQVVGFMNEDLFIDWVDLEWCWRLRKAGFRLIGNASALVQHVLGDYSKNIGFRDVPLRNYVRHYYITRNAFFLSLYCPSLNRMQKIHLAVRSIKYLIGFPLLGRDKLKNFRVVFLGLWHGMRGNLGKFK